MSNKKFFELGKKYLIVSVTLNLLFIMGVVMVAFNLEISLAKLTPLPMLIAHIFQMGLWFFIFNLISKDNIDVKKIRHLIIFSLIADLLKRYFLDSNSNMNLTDLARNLEQLQSVYPGMVSAARLYFGFSEYVSPVLNFFNPVPFGGAAIVVYFLVASIYEKNIES